MILETVQIQYEDTITGWGGKGQSEDSSWGCLWDSRLPSTHSRTIISCLDLL